MEFKLTKEMLQEQGSKILWTGITTDKIINYYGWGNPDKHLKIVLVKGFINDWCIYVESMEEDMTFQEVKEVGNKICNPETIKLLVDCDEEVLARYRY